MAISCTPTSLSAASSCLACDLTHKQLLAALVYVLCTSNNMSCTPSSLVAASECIRCAMTEKQMLAAMVFLICNGGTGGTGGSGAQLVLYTTTNPTTDGVTPTNINANAIAYRADGTQPIFVWDPVGHAWH